MHPSAFYFFKKETSKEVALNWYYNIYILSFLVITN